jgi:WD40 repeat protein
MSIPVTGGESRRILCIDGETPVVGVRCAVQPDSTCVIVVRDGAEFVVRPFRLDGELEPAVLRVDVDTDEGSGMDTRFDISPDGSQIVVTEWQGRIRVFDLGTGESRELLDEWVGHPQRVYWSRNGTALYLTGIDGLAPYWVATIDLEGHVKVLWESESTWINRAIPSPDDSSLVFQSVRCRGDIWMIEGF